MGIPGAVDKTKARLCCGSMQAKQMGGKHFQGVQGLEKSGLCSGQLAFSSSFVVLKFVCCSVPLRSVELVFSIENTGSKWFFKLQG